MENGLKDILRKKNKSERNWIPEKIFSDYDYFSSYSNTWLNHSKDYYATLSTLILILDFYTSKGWGDLIDVRLEVLPGIAGLAQSKGVFNKGESLTEGPNKFRYDALYVMNQNLCFDIALLFKCIILVITRRL